MDTGPALSIFEVFGQTGPLNLGAAIFQRYLLTYFLPRENNDIANVSLSGSRKAQIYA